MKTAGDADWICQFLLVTLL